MTDAGMPRRAPSVGMPPAPASGSAGSPLPPLPGMPHLAVRGVSGLPEVEVGADLAALIVAASREAGLAIRVGDVVVVSSKVVSKAAGLSVRGRRTDVVASQTLRVVAERQGPGGITRIVEGRAGPVMAAAGVDASNVGPRAALADDGRPEPTPRETPPDRMPHEAWFDAGRGGAAYETLLVLPTDPDAEASALRAGVLTALGLPLDTALGVIVSDTAGRPWRSGQVDYALGSAGVLPVLDHRGTADADGRPMVVTVRCVVDELAAAADLVKGKTDQVPVAVVSGCPSAWLSESAPGSRSVVRTGASDWFAYGHVEAIRWALGVVPGSPESAGAGVPPSAPDGLGARVGRVVAVALAGLDDAGVDVALPGGAESARQAAEGLAHGSALLSLSAPDDLTLGRLLARLDVAAASEGLKARWHADDPHLLTLTPAAR